MKNKNKNIAQLHTSINNIAVNLLSVVSTTCYPMAIQFLV